MSYSIRLFEATDADYEAVASLYTACADPVLDFEYEHTSPDLLRHFHEGFGPNLAHLRCFLVVDDASQQPIGVAQYFPLLWLAEPHSYWLMIRIHPQFQGCGIGNALYCYVSGELAARGAQMLMIQVHEDTPEIAAWVHGRGFQEAFRSWQLVLDVAHCDDRLLHQQLGSAETPGITITTLAEEQRADPLWLVKLYDLHMSFVPDIPVPDHPNPAPPLSWFAEYVFNNPQSLPDGFFIAKDGDRYIGESFVQRDGDPASGMLHHKLTGVRKEGRGRGLATALKLKTIRYAREHGYRQVSTWNESSNERMLSINKKVGFVCAGGSIFFKKRVAAARQLMPFVVRARHAALPAAS